MSVLSVSVVVKMSEDMYWDGAIGLPATVDGYDANVGTTVSVLVSSDVDKQTTIWSFHVASFKDCLGDMLPGY